MIEGIIICALLIAALVFLHWLYDWPVRKEVKRMPIPAMPPVKPTRQPAASVLYGVPYGESEHRQGWNRYDDDSSALAGIAAAAAVVIIADTVYDSFVDTTPAYEYSSPTQTDYSSPSYDSPSVDSSNW